MATSTTDMGSSSPAPGPSPTTNPSQAPRATTTCDAAQALFCPQLYPYYLGWQASILNYGGALFSGPEAQRVQLFKSRRSDVLGDLPSLLQYKHFIRYMIQAALHIVFSEYFAKGQHHRNNGQPHWIPFLCGHRPHPGNKIRLTVMCSRCLVSHNHDSLKRIAEARELMVRDREDGTKFRDLDWRLCSKIWSYQKFLWRELVDALEVEAELEAKWESEWRDEGLDIEQAVAGTVRSSEVLKEAYTKCPSMFDGWDLKFTPKPKLEARSCRYASIFRLEIARADRETCGLTAGSSCGSSCARLDTRAKNTADSPCKSMLLCAGSSGETADRSSSPDTIAPSSPKASLIIPQVMRKQFCWAEDVFDYVSRDRSQYHRPSSWYEPGRWACPEHHGWEHPYGPDHEGEEDSDDDCSDEEDSDNTDTESLVVHYPSSEDADFQDSLTEVQTSQSPTMVQRTVCKDGEFVDTNPLASYDETSTKRRRLNDVKPACLSEWSDSHWSDDSMSGSDWQEAEAKCEATINDSIRKNGVQGLSFKADYKASPLRIEWNDTGNRAGDRTDEEECISVNIDSLVAYDERRIKRRPLSCRNLLSLSDMQKGAWDGALNDNGRTEPKKYVQSLSSDDYSLAPEDAVNDGDNEEKMACYLKELELNLARGEAARRQRSSSKGVASKQL